MPIITDTPRTLNASCGDGLCEGYGQVEVKGVERTIAYTYLDNRGPSNDPHDVALNNAVERSVVQYLWSDEADRLCPHCGQPRILEEQVRPVYARLSRQDPLLLLKMERGLIDATAAIAQAASPAEVESMRSEIAALRRELATSRNGHDEDDAA